MFSDLWDTSGLRAVLLRADGPNFSFGGDLKKFHPERANLAPLVRRWTADLHMGLQRAWRLPVPIVAAVQGFAMGGGVALVAGCDVVLAGESARLGSAFAQLGFSCDSGSSATLTARMGLARARRFVLLAEVLSSQDALQAGLVDRVVADDKLQDEALALAQGLAQGPTLAYGEIKRLFLRAGAAQLRGAARGRGADARPRVGQRGCPGRNRGDGRTPETGVSRLLTGRGRSQAGRTRAGRLK